MTAFAAALSLTVTEVDAVATVTPVIVRVATMLWEFESTAVTIELGADATLYGGVPPLIETV